MPRTIQIHTVVQSTYTLDDNDNIIHVYQSTTDGGELHRDAEGHAYDLVAHDWTSDVPDELWKNASALVDAALRKGHPE